MRPRGLGRGLGALIPAAPVDRGAPAADPVSGSGPATSAALESTVAPPGSEAVRALDRWLWRSGEVALPSVPAAGREPSPDVPRGTSAAILTVVGSTDADRASSLPAGAVPDVVPPADSIPVALPEPATADPAAHPADDGLAPAGGAIFAELDPRLIGPNPRQPRQIFDPEAIAELAASIREVGLLQPVVVREAAGGRYELVMGERRWRAFLEAGLDRIPAIIRATGDDILLRDALLENIQRVQLNPLEEAAAYGQLLEDFGCTQEELATRLGRSRPQVTNTLRLLRLSPPVQRRVAAGVLSAGHAKALLGLTDARAQEVLAGRIVAEGLSVRTVEELVSAGTPAGSARHRAGRAPLPTAGAGSAVADRLSDRLETRVTVVRTRSRGRLLIEFATDGDLTRIADLIDPPAQAPGTTS